MCLLDLVLTNKQEVEKTPKIRSKFSKIKLQYIPKTKHDMLFKWNDEACCGRHCSCGMKFWSRWTAASCWRRAANKVCVWCGRGWPQLLPACLKSLQPISLSAELWYTAVCFCPTQQCSTWRRRRGGWTQLTQCRSASSVMAGPFKQWPKCFLTYSALGKDYEKFIQKHWHSLSSDPKPENEFTKNVQASS